MLPAADQTLIRIQSIITAELVERQTLFPTNVAMHIFYPTIRQTFCTSDNAMVELGRVLFQVEYLDQLCFPCSTTSSSSCRPFHSFEEWRNQYCSISRLMDATDFCQIRLSTLPVPLRIPHIVTLFLITPSFSAFGSGPGIRLDLELQAPTAFLSPAPISCSHSLQISALNLPAHSTPVSSSLQVRLKSQITKHSISKPFPLDYSQFLTLSSLTELLRTSYL